MSALVDEITRWIPIPWCVVEARHRILSARGHDTIVIFTMGKVGSTTVYRAVKRGKSSPLVYHIHYLTPGSIDDVIGGHRASGIGVREWVRLRSFLRNDFDNLKSSRMLAGLPTRERWRVITCVRDPVATLISHVFQNPSIHRPELMEGESLDEEKVIEYILARVRDFDSERDVITNWFDFQFREALGIDVYESEFDPDKGYAILEEHGLRVGVIAVEKMDEGLGTMISEMGCGKSGMEISSENTRERQSEGGLYRRILDRIDFPRSSLDRIYGTRYARHFYSPDQIAGFVARWSDGGEAGARG